MFDILVFTVPTVKKIQFLEKAEIGMEDFVTVTYYTGVLLRRARAKNMKYLRKHTFTDRRLM